MFLSKSYSLADIVGADYIEAAVNAAVKTGLIDIDSARNAAYGEVELLSPARAEQNDAMLGFVGEKVTEPFNSDNSGAPTASFRRAQHMNAAPLSALGCCRVGEDGRLYFAGKSEHYHASLGHSFEGYRLIEHARALGIPNATHNNTRGYITRLCERELVRAANGECGDEELDNIIASEQPKILNRVINLETGSLAVEAGVKMMLARFYRLDASFPAPKYAGKIPVFLVIGDFGGGVEANYHGTTIMTQTFRGLWGGFYEAAERAGLYKVVPVSINDADDFKAKIDKYNSGNYKTAGFLHEIVLMNYGAVLLTREFLTTAYEYCAASDTPVLVDEIQSCMWYGGMFLFRRYGLKPDFAVCGKGFPGGEYPASKLITTAEMDTLNQFGALVTNGQEELASLAYLITMRFSRDNSAEIDRLGAYFEAGLCRIAAANPDAVRGVNGLGHCAGIEFSDVDKAAAVMKIIGEKYCIDASAQLYKLNCPPVILLKPPLITSERAMDFLLGRISDALKEFAGNTKNG